jgi:hypothetical protein
MEARLVLKYRRAKDIEELSQIRQRHKGFSGVLKYSLKDI